jgi:Flp pilus assembly protein TadD
MSLHAELQTAHDLLRQQRLPEAEAACRSALQRSPSSAPALHLLGLILKGSGDLAESERLMRQSLQFEPGRAEFHANLGNLLRRMGRLAEAEPAYRRALELDGNAPASRLGLARTLNDLGRRTEAERECRALVEVRARDPEAWCALAMTLRDQQRHAEAEAAYRQAIMVGPDYAPARHNLAVLLVNVERTEEALAQLDQAKAMGMDAAELEFMRGRALLELYRFDEAEQAFERTVRLAPANPEGQLALARLRYMRGDPAFARDLSAAVTANRGDVRLQMQLADVLRRVGDLQNAEALLRDCIERHGAAPELQSSLATVLQESGRLREAEREALAAATARPGVTTIIQNLVAILLGLGRAGEAMPFIQTERKRNPLDQSWIAYEATAARLLGTDLYRELYDYERLVKVYDIEPPAGWASMAELNAALVSVLSARHGLSQHPFDQSLRHGTQTARSLLVDRDPAIQAVLKAFLPSIADYRARIGIDSAHPLRDRNRGMAQYAGCWSVRLNRDGYHVNHIHPEGWISSAYYISVPAESADNDKRSGWIKFGEPRMPVPDATAERVVQPKAGRLVLFPSYMWHGTTPILGAEPRLTMAFDVVPRLTPPP